MKRLLLVCATTLALDPAFAAPRMAAGPSPVPPPVFTWTGFHVGVNGGYGGGVLSATNAWIEPTFNTSVLNGATSRVGGFFVGGQIGADYQFANNVVLGLESDVQWSDVRQSGEQISYGATPAVGVRREISSAFSMDWFGTTRVRLGYALGRFLPYVTAGVAYGDFTGWNYGATLTSLGGQYYSNNRTTVTRAGWTVGAGVEYALTRALSLKSEYLYAEFGGVPATFTEILGVPGPTRGGAGVSASHSFGAHIVRAGLNYRFGGLGYGGPDFGTSPLAMLSAGPTRNWSGVYVGANGGFGGGTIDIFPWSANPAEGYSSRISSRMSGFFIGGQIGYNHQFANNVVVGLESDAQWNDIRQSDTLNSLRASPTLIQADPYISSHGAALWLGTTRMRVGYAFDRFFPYVTGGVAYGELGARSESYQVHSNGYYDFYHAAGARMAAGWTAGAGVEYAITDRLSIKTEYGYVEIEPVGGASHELYRSPGGAVPIIGAFRTAQIGNHIVRAGLNFSVGGFDPGAIFAR